LFAQGICGLARSESSRSFDLLKQHLLPLLIPLFVPVLSRFLPCFTVRSMARESSTIKLRDRAPEFMLLAVNMPQAVSLKTLLGNGPVVVEFLRGTW
jgi:hypothetical protein